MRWTLPTETALIRAATARQGIFPLLRAVQLNRDRRSGHQMCLRGSKEQVGPGDVIDLGPGLVVGVWHRGPVRRGVDDARDDAVYGDRGTSGLVRGHRHQV